MNQLIPWFEIAAMAASWLAIQQIRQSPSLWVFPVLLTIIVGVDSTQIIFQTGAYHNNTLIYNLQEPIIWLLYASSLYLAFNAPKFKRITVGSGLLYLLVAIITMPYYLREQQFNVILVAVGSALIIGLILLKLYEMLESPMGFNFLRKPYFYILFLYLIFNVSTLPYFTMVNWLVYDLGREDIIKVLKNVMSVMNVLLYATYTVCFLWIRVTKVSS
ncbi:MAG TPA: hypothetical protein DCE41_21635 [Cytophagales bacterium]|nr:hypothetical protein [Cytophagales bacterium]HAA19529.1 hypothetical protein [Cytophagales bacterium]HAP59596.1 hypothetical protein [Cytophagales bacterium]